MAADTRARLTDTMMAGSAIKGFSATTSRATVVTDRSARPTARFSPITGPGVSVRSSIQLRAPHPRRRAARLDAARRGALARPIPYRRRLIIPVDRPIRRRRADRTPRHRQSSQNSTNAERQPAMRPEVLLKRCSHDAALLTVDDPIRVSAYAAPRRAPTARPRQARVNAVELAARHQIGRRPWPAV